MVSVSSLVIIRYIEIMKFPYFSFLEQLFYINIFALVEVGGLQLPW